MTGPFGPVGGARFPLRYSTIKSEDLKSRPRLALGSAGLQSAISLLRPTAHICLLRRLEDLHPKPLTGLPLISNQVRYSIDSDAWRPAINRACVTYCVPIPRSRTWNGNATGYGAQGSCTPNSAVREQRDPVSPGPQIPTTSR